MTISEQINAIRDKYDPHKNDYETLAISKYCRNGYALSLKECQRCGYCGREFDANGNLLGSEIEEADEQIFTATRSHE